MRRFSLWLLILSPIVLDAELAAYGQELPNGYGGNEYLQLYLNEHH